MTEYSSVPYFIAAWNWDEAWARAKKLQKARRHGMRGNGSGKVGEPQDHLRLRQAGSAFVMPVVETIELAGLRLGVYLVFGFWRLVFSMGRMFQVSENLRQILPDMSSAYLSSQ